MMESTTDTNNTHDNFNTNYKDAKSNNTIGRFALSKNICRFELPMDMKEFESRRKK